MTSVPTPNHNFDRVDPELLERARRFGQHVHAATDLLDRNNLDEETLDSGLVAHLDGYKLFLLETGFTVTHSEEQLYNPRQKYAGTLDKRGIWKGTTWVLDLKSGAVPRTVGLQTAAYQQACEEKPRRRLGLQLLPNNYKLHACEDPADWSYFVSFLNVHRYMHKGITHASSEDQIAAA